MTDTTILVGLYMVDFFRCGETGIVTGCAVIDDAGVTKAGRSKTGGLVAVDAITVSWHMSIILARGGNTVVT